MCLIFYPFIILFCFFTFPFLMIFNLYIIKKSHSRNFPRPTSLGNAAVEAMCRLLPSSILSGSHEWNHESVFCFEDFPTVVTIYCTFELRWNALHMGICTDPSDFFCFNGRLLPLELRIESSRAIAQAVSRWLPTAAARVRSQVRLCGICGVQSGTGAGFLRVLRFPLPFLIPPTAPYSSSIIRGWYNRPNSGRRTKWTQSHPTQRN
jgi:hypothetical protein